MKLKQISKTTVYPKAPYNFKYSTQNPSHFPTPIGENTDSAMWFTMHWRNQPIGVQFVNRGSVNKSAVEVTIYTKKAIDREAIIKELAYRFEWYEDYLEFYKLAKKDSKLTTILRKFRGMRMFCAENLYDYLMIAILLQNANVKRTTQMTKAMLENYGDLLEFDGKKLYCFWTPEKILKVSEEELRKLKVGYRAKSFLRASQDYLKLNEEEMRHLNNEELKKALLSIHGVGPASLDYLMRDVFHRRDALNTIPPWEAKIYSRILRIKTTDPKRIFPEIKKRYGEWRAVAVHYLFMDLTWKHKEKPIEWFGKLMPY
jgi:3-methyladenine DNA glycosylase/8-oxoguanine DNA glycosylase